MEIVGITISESKPGYVILYTKDYDEIEYNKQYIKKKLGAKKYNNLLTS